MLGVEPMNISKINALNFLDLSHHRRPLLPYLYAMAGRSEMSPEERMRGSDAVLADVHVENVRRIKTDAAQCSTAELNKLVAGAGLASRRVSGALAMSRKGVADQIKATAASALKASAANENDIDANPEMEMDDDSGRTPERVAALDAEVQRRLAALARRCETKQLDGRNSMVAAGPSNEGAAGGAGGAPGGSA